MAFFSVITDATKPLDTSNWISTDRKPQALTKEQKAVLGNHKHLVKSTTLQPVPEDMDVDAAIQESVPWTEVKRKNQSTTTEKVDETENMSMKKVKVTFAIRVPKDISNFAPAKLHIDTLHEMHKFDESMIVFDSAGDKKINIEGPMLDYKDTFKPVEKRVGRGTGWISISHTLLMTKKASECKEAVFPFLKKNKVFLYINPKPGLEHFAAIGILFGPNPDYIWRDELADLLIDTMKTVITDEEKNILGTSDSNEPKIILSLNIQTVGNTIPTPTTTIALEIRVPNEQKSTYIDILQRLYENAQEQETIIPSTLGKFFPYYMKSKMPEVFNFMMRQQNAEMADTAIIPIFGYTTEVRQAKIQIDGQETTVELAMATTKNIIRLATTPSSWNLHKYLVIVHKENKDDVTTEIQKIFNKIQEPLENQPPNFPVPRCGGSEKMGKIRDRPGPKQRNSEEQIDKTTSTYMVSLETIALANNPQDAGPTSPPKRYRKFTISYASAASAGIIKEPSSNPPPKSNPQTNPDANEPDNKSDWQDASNKNNATNRQTESSLSRTLTNSSTPSKSRNIDSELQEIKNSLENRMDRQDEQISEIVQVIKTMNDDFEKRMIHVVLAALSREKEKVQELTHGRVYTAEEAPLADEEGNLPFGGKVQLGGPLDRLHHVEVTVQQMANALDTIADHLIQKDPTAKHLFQDDDSEVATIIENETQPTSNFIDLANDSTHEDSHMVIREYSGSKRQLSSSTSPQKSHIKDTNQTSPRRSPPSKKERSNLNESPADPDQIDWERGTT
jgi:hypothetical protein